MRCWLLKKPSAFKLDGLEGIAGVSRFRMTLGAAHILLGWRF
jgi:hypothetical protein